MMKRVFTAAAVAAIVCVLIASLCACTGDTSYQAMGTNISIRVKGADASKAIREIEKLVETVDAAASTSREGSDVYRINHASAHERVTVSDLTARLLEKAFSYSEETGGAFDPTVYPLVDLWQFSADNVHSANKRAPTAREIAERLALCGRDKFIIEGNVVTKTLDGAMLDLGGIAKGYIADEAARIFRECGVDEGIADIGRNLWLYGGRDFKVGISNPRKTGTDTELIAKYAVRNLSVVTSGDYERYFEYEGKRYHHIIDPATGAPADKGVIACTVIGEESALCDVVATAAVVLGEEGAAELMGRLGLSGLIVIEENGKYYYRQVGEIRAEIVDGRYEERVGSLG